MRVTSVVLAVVVVDLCAAIFLAFKIGAFAIFDVGEEEVATVVLIETMMGNPEDVATVNGVCTAAVWAGVVGGTCIILLLKAGENTSSNTPTKMPNIPICPRSEWIRGSISGIYVGMRTCSSFSLLRNSVRIWKLTVAT